MSKEMTIQESFDNFIMSRLLSGLSDKSIRNYRGFVYPFICFMGADVPVKGIKQADIDKYISSVIMRPISKATRATYIRNLKIFLRWCQDQYDVNFNAKVIKVPKPSKRNVRIYSAEEVKLLFDSIHAENEWLTVRNKCIIALMYDSGLRQSEVCTLRRSRMTLDDNLMIVRGKGDKERTVPIGKLTRQFMDVYNSICPYHSDTFFVTRRGEPLTNNSVKLMVTKLADKLPFELSSHKLRHNFATNYCIDQYEKYGQMDVYKLMYLMGHEDVQTTKIYLHFAYEIIASRGNISHLDSVMLNI